MQMLETFAGRAADDQGHDLGINVGAVHHQASMVPVGDDVHGAQMVGHDRVVDDSILKASKDMVKSDDVFFKAQTAGQGDPPFGAFDVAVGDRKPFMEAGRVADQGPHGVGWGIDECLAPYRSHRRNSTLTSSYTPPDRRFAHGISESLVESGGQ